MSGAPGLPADRELPIGCPLWVKSRHPHCKNPCLLYFQKRTCVADGEAKAGAFSSWLGRDERVEHFFHYVGCFSKYSSISFF
jgi:hypothetical protein